MPSESRGKDREGASVEELLRSLRGELLELFDYSDVQGNRTLVRGELVRALDSAIEEAKKSGTADWRTPEVRYKYVSPVLDRLSKVTGFLTPEYLRDTVNRRLLEGRSLEVDGFGMDPEYLKRLEPFLDFLYERYWRVEVEGMDHVPHRGAAILFSNHSGTLPWDAIMISKAVRREHPEKRQPRFLVEDLFMTVPFLAPFLSRMGLVRASRENARRLLKQGDVVGVFPEGAKGISKYYKERYQVQRFGRGGFVRLALSSGAPLIPVAVVGAEETMPMIGKLTATARAIGLPYLPITPTWPALGPLGLVPFPTKWNIKIGPPIDLSKHGKKALDDEILINQITEESRATIQEMIYELLKNRKSAWTG
ncbi:MAG: lysophospholipid acyltransferase family protein [Bdellovibrionota bacterium]